MANIRSKEREREREIGAVGEVEKKFGSPQKQISKSKNLPVCDKRLEIGPNSW